MHKFIRIVNAFSEWTGQVVKWLVPILIITICYDTVMRYFFNKPTIWSFTLSYMIGGTFFVIGQAYLQKHKGNVRVDLFYAKYSSNIKLLFDAISSLLVFLPVYIYLTKTFWMDFFQAYQRMEVDISSTWYAPLWPFKLFIAVGFTIFLIQFIADILQNILEYRKTRSAEGGEGKC
ncbi:MAG: TRAP transporter small permease subunit [Peptococcaceae bacterium]|jgi:TRAP-type mannitol/chloroaromatic compound transport system permease small subunit|nr:TRAP transporter small permease subunit [Peptococcaceae bacterium]MDH7525377.1 TRAP transporter small permease subunit [Peptococcaceae bacterium]